MSRMREMRGGRENDPCFGSRMVGVGELADLLEKRFEIACRRIGFNTERGRDFDTSLFAVPGGTKQLPLF
jgi:hypothetical protein